MMLAVLLGLGGGGVWALFPVTAGLSVPVLLHPPPGLAVLDPPEDALSVLASGPRILVRLLVARRPAFSPDLSGAGAGVVTVPTGLPPESVPWGVRVEAGPATLRFTLEREVRKEVPVRVRTVGEPPGGYTVTALSAAPERVVLAGPESLVAPMEEAPTRPVPLAGRTGNVREKAALDLPGRAVQASVSGPVEVLVDIERMMGEIRLAGVPVTVLSPDGFRAQVRPQAANLLVRGPVDVLAGLSRTSGVDIRLDAQKLAPGVYTRKPVIGLPPEAALISAEPAEFSLEVWGEEDLTNP